MGLGLLQSPHSTAPTRMTALKRKRSNSNHQAALHRRVLSTKGRGLGQDLAAHRAQHWGTQWGISLANGNTCWGRPKLRCPKAALPHITTELRLVATPVWRLGRGGMVELAPLSPALSLGEVPRGCTFPCTHTDTKHPHTCSSSTCTRHPRAGQC